MKNIKKIITILSIVCKNIRRIFSSYYYLNYYQWRLLKNKYKGKRIFIIGNGPSLNETPLFLLKNEYTLTFNRFYLMDERINWAPTFYMMSDGVVLNDNIEEVKKTINQTELSFFPDRYESFHFTKILPKLTNIRYFHQEPIPFSRILPYVGSGGTVAFIAFEVLSYLGFSEIYFLGIDMNYVVHDNARVISQKYNQEIQSLGDDDPNHFDVRYFGKGKKYHQPDQKVLNSIIESLNRAAKYFKKHSKIVVNVGLSSKVDSFPKANLIDVLKYNKDDIDELFLNLIQKYGYESLASFEKQCVFLSESTSWNNKSNIVSLPVKEALKVIKNKMTDYIPIGPYQNLIYFILRSTQMN